MFTDPVYPCLMYPLCQNPKKGAATNKTLISGADVSREVFFEKAIILVQLETRGTTNVPTIIYNLYERITNNR